MRTLPGTRFQSVHSARGSVDLPARHWTSALARRAARPVGARKAGRATAQRGVELRWRPPVEQDEDILEAAAAGNATRVATLIFARHGAMLYGQARCLVDIATADDVVQDAIVSVVQALVAGDFKRNASLRSYAVSVVRYKAFHYRRSFWYGVLHRRAVVPDVLDELPAAEPAEDAPRSEAEDQRLSRCMAQLGAETRVVIAMRLEGRSHAEIAKVLGISRAKSEQLCSRGVRRCQQLLKEGEPE